MKRRKFVKLIAAISLGLISSFIPVRLLAKLRVIQFKTVGTSGDLTKANIAQHIIDCKAVLDEQGVPPDNRYIRWMPLPEYNGKKWGEEEI